MFSTGNTVIHPIHGLGTVTGLEEQEIMGQHGIYASIYFQAPKITIKVRADGEEGIIRSLIDESDIAKVMEHLGSGLGVLPTKSSDRYNVNLKKIKSNNIYSLAEVVRDLTSLSQDRRLSPKEQTMLRQTRHAIALEFAHITDGDIERYESDIDDICRDSHRILR